VVVPVVYCYMDDFANWCLRLFTGKAAQRTDTLQSPPKIEGLPHSAE
jgi:hypothetical protein